MAAAAVTVDVADIAVISDFSQPVLCRCEAWQENVITCIPSSCSIGYVSQAPSIHTTISTTCHSHNAATQWCQGNSAFGAQLKTPGKHTTGSPAMTRLVPCEHLFIHLVVAGHAQSLILHDARKEQTGSQNSIDSCQHRQQ